MKLVSNTEIITNISNKYLKHVSINSSREALILLPKAIESMEKEYKSLWGISKKELVITLIVSLMKTADVDEAEINLVKSFYLT